MCKKFLCFLLSFLTLMIIPGCYSGANFKDGDMDIYKKIHKKYAYMKSYTAKAEMTVYSNKTENKYSILQYAKEPKMYRTEFLSEDGKTELLSIEKEGKIRICTFINNFFALFYKSQETAVSVSSQSDRNFISLETDIFPPSKNIKKAVMLVDENADVKSIKIYDAGGNLHIETIFTEFNYNAEINNELFDLR